MECLDYISMEQLLTIITILGASIAYVFSRWRDRRLEIFKLKSDAYADFLKTFEFLVPEKDDQLIHEHEKIRELNRATGKLTIYAPARVIKSIQNIINKNKNKLDRSSITDIEVILHNDLYSFGFLNFRDKLDKQNVLWFPFKKN